VVDVLDSGKNFCGAASRGRNIGDHFELTGSESFADESTHQLSSVQLVLHFFLVMVVFFKVDLVLAEFVERMGSLTLIIEVVLESRHLGDEFIRLQVVLEVTQVVINLSVNRLLLVPVVGVDVLLFTLRKVTFIIEVNKALLVGLVFEASRSGLFPSQLLLIKFTEPSSTVLASRLREFLLLA